MNSDPGFEKFADADTDPGCEKFEDPDPDPGLHFYQKLVFIYVKKAKNNNFGSESHHGSGSRSRDSRKCGSWSRSRDFKYADPMRIRIRNPVAKSLLKRA